MTAVEWLIDRIAEVSVMEKGRYYIPYNSGTIDITHIIEQAKEMEKQQIEDAHIEGQRVFDKHPHTQWNNDQAEHYYAETYGSKGSDDREPKDVVLGYKTSLEAQMLDSQIPQTEISDEEIAEKAEEFELTNGVYGFKHGVKWYREQLKQRQ